MIQEINRKCASGYLALVVLPLLNILDGWWFYRSVMAESPAGVVTAVLGFAILMICYKGFFMVHPNQAKVLQLFGKYVGQCAPDWPSLGQSVLCQGSGFASCKKFRKRSTQG